VAETDFFVHPTAEVSPESRIGVGTKVWHQAQVLGNAIIGENCTLGKGVFIGEAIVGSQVKFGNYASVFGATIEDEAFIGPYACVMEDRHPRSTNPDGTRKGHDDYVHAPVTIRRGASLGAGAIILPGVTIGRYAMISAGAVINKDVPDHGLMVGNPARQVGFACLCGLPLPESLTCSCGRGYVLNGEQLSLDQKS
jgi:UDP-2-acetamido-3-amino-2,3-dideoxy-glucuronate N-acetyltransferase